MWKKKKGMKREFIEIYSPYRHTEIAELQTICKQACDAFPVQTEKSWTWLGSTARICAFRELTLYEQQFNMIWFSNHTGMKINGSYYKFCFCSIGNTSNVYTLELQKKTVHTLCIIWTVLYVKKKIKARIGDDQTLKISFTVKVGLIKNCSSKD